MSITKKHRKKNRNNKSKRRNYKRRTRTSSFRGRARGTVTNNQVYCCMCHNAATIADTLVPQQCLQQHGSRAHRICQHCWWDPENGFAREGVNHKCPGCETHFPLTVQVKGKSPKPEDIISISD
jgi:hypothetical protein